VHRLACSFADHPAVDVTVLSCDKKRPAHATAIARSIRFALNNRWARLFLLPFLLNFMDFRELRRRPHAWRRLVLVLAPCAHGTHHARFALREAQSATRLRRQA